MNMAAPSTSRKESLELLPKNVVIFAKRISQGGDLILVKQRAEEGSKNCESDHRKGRVCVLGSLAQLISIKGVKIKHDVEDCRKVKTSSVRPEVMVASKPCGVCGYEQFRLNITGFQPKKDGGIKKPFEEPKSIDEAKLIEKPEPLMETETKTDQMVDFVAEAKETSAEKRTTTASEPSDIISIDHRDWLENVLPAPLHTICEYSVLVKWKQHPSIPCYTMRSVFDVLSKYGRIAAMGQLSINSCLVLFENFHGAVLAVRAALIGPKAYPLICQWYYPLMYRDSIDMLDVHPYKKPKIISEEAKRLHRFREMQEQVKSCLKHRGAGLSYDRASFNR